MVKRINYLLLLIVISLSLVACGTVTNSDSTRVITDEQKWSPKPPFYYKNKMTLLS